MKSATASFDKFSKTSELSTSIKTSHFNSVLRRSVFQVMLDGHDVTPLKLYDEEFGIIDLSTMYDATALKLVTSTIVTTLAQIMEKEAALQAESEKKKTDETPTQFPYPYEPEPYFAPNQNLLILLKETDTFFHLGISPLTAENLSEEGIQVQRDNEFYEYLTTGPGKHRKKIEEEIQTLPLILKSKSTMLERNQMAHKKSQVNIFRLYDANRGEEENDLTEKKNTKSNQQQMLELVRKDTFQDAVDMIGRILATNIYFKEQSIFSGTLFPDPYRINVEFKYTLTLLWTFTYEKAKNRSVVCIKLNRANREILAIGYGKFNYIDTIEGLVCIWCIKNPVYPEREFSFESAVTDISFSTQHPNWLAVGLDNGLVFLCDISSRTKSIIAESSRATSPSCEPIWQVGYYISLEGKEQLFTAGQDGRILRYSDKEMATFPMMRIPRREGKLHGINEMRHCLARGISICLNPAALVLTFHPTNPLIYLVGTEEGCIHRCSINYLHKHLGMLKVHDGPVYAISYSLLCDKIFLTCGADWCARVWAEGIDEPLFTLSQAGCFEPVFGARWSPTNATIIACIRGIYIDIWDIQRKTFKPASTKVSPTNTLFTWIRFTADGNNLIVGDIEGNAHIFGLTDMPHFEHYQDKSLVNAILKTLETRPDLIKELKRKVGPPFV